MNELYLLWKVNPKNGNQEACVIIDDKEVAELWEQGTIDNNIMYGYDKIEVVSLHNAMELVKYR